MKTKVFCSAVIFLFAFAGCNGDGREQTSTILTETSWEEMAFSDSEKDLKDAFKTAIAISGDYIYIGTSSSGLWAKKFSDSVFTQVVFLGVDPPYQIHDIKPFSGGIIALASSGAVRDFVVVKKDKLYGAEELVKELTNYDFNIVSGEEEDFLVAAGKSTKGEATVNFLRLKDVHDRNDTWSTKVTNAEKQAIKFDVAALVKHRSDLLIFGQDGSYFRFAKNGILKDGFKSTDQIAEKLDFEKFKLEAGSKKEIYSAWSNNEAIFVNFGDDLAIVSGPKLDQYQPAQKVKVEQFSTDGTQSLLITKKGYYIATKEKLGPLIDIAYTKNHLFASKDQGKLSEQKDGWHKPLAQQEFSFGAIAGKNIYLISADGKSVFIIKTKDIKVTLAD